MFGIHTVAESPFFNPMASATFAQSVFPTLSPDIGVHFRTSMKKCRSFIMSELPASDHA